MLFVLLRVICIVLCKIMPIPWRNHVLLRQGHLFDQLLVLLGILVSWFPNSPSPSSPFGRISCLHVVMHLFLAQAICLFEPTLVCQQYQLAYLVHLCILVSVCKVFSSLSVWCVL